MFLTASGGHVHLREVFGWVFEAEGVVLGVLGVLGEFLKLKGGRLGMGKTGGTGTTGGKGRIKGKIGKPEELLLSFFGGVFAGAGAGAGVGAGTGGGGEGAGAFIGAGAGAFSSGGGGSGNWSTGGSGF